MPPEHESDLRDSAFEFERLVWPVLGPACGGGQIFCMERAPEEMAKAFDQHAGIDYVQLIPGVGLRGIASRVQWLDEGAAPYQTFTIRTVRLEFGTKTEFAKLTDALESTRGVFFPHLFIQAYVTNPRREGRLLSAAVAYTRDIIRWLQNHPDRLEESLTQRKNRSSRFVYVAWQELIEAGAKLTIAPSREAPLEPMVQEPVQMPLTGVPAPPRKLRQLSLVFEDDEPAARLLDATPNTWRKQSC